MFTGMFMLDQSTVEIIIVLGLVGFVFVAFIQEMVPPEIAAMGGVAVLLALEILTIDEVLSVFSSNATAIIAAMFILSASLERTGIIEYMARNASRLAKNYRSLSIMGVLLIVFVLSMFVNNTSVVVIMTPVMISLAYATGTVPSKMLIPLSYMSIFAGTSTLIGSSTNIIVDGVARDQGIEPFGIFEITAPGLMLAGVGMLYMVTIGRWLLPHREPLTSFLNQEDKSDFITKFIVPEDSKLIGKTIKQAGLVPDKGFKVMNITREGKHKQRMRSVKLQAHDQIILKTSQRELLGMHNEDDDSLESYPLEFLEALNYKGKSDKPEKTIIVEGIVGKQSHFLNKRVGELNMRQTFNSVILAVHRPKGRMSRFFDKVKVLLGDKLILEGTPEGIRDLFRERELINIEEVEGQGLRRRKAPIAIMAIVGVVGLAAFDVMPLAALAIIAAVLVILFGCIEADDAYRAIEWRILFLIFGMLALSIAMEKTGAAQLIVNQAMQLVEGYPPIVVLSILYLLTSVMTEIFSNNASAVILTSIAIGIAHQMGVDPRPFVVAVMFGASASFATPIGYQTNTFVFNSGGYKFLDFVKVGLPLNLLMWAIATLVIPIFWPL